MAMTRSENLGRSARPLSHRRLEGYTRKRTFGKLYRAKAEERTAALARKRGE